MTPRLTARPGHLPPGAKPATGKEGGHPACLCAICQPLPSPQRTYPAPAAPPPSALAAQTLRRPCPRGPAYWARPRELFVQIKEFFRTLALGRRDVRPRSWDRGPPGTLALLLWPLGGRDAEKRQQVALPHHGDPSPAASQADPREGGRDLPSGVPGAPGHVWIVPRGAQWNSRESQSQRRVWPLLFAGAHTSGIFCTPWGGGGGYVIPGFRSGDRGPERFAVSWLRSSRWKRCVPRWAGPAAQRPQDLSQLPVDGGVGPHPGGQACWGQGAGRDSTCR